MQSALCDRLCSSATPLQAVLQSQFYLSTSVILRFAISSLVYLAIVGTQIFIRETIYRRDPHQPKPRSIPRGQGLQPPPPRDEAHDRQPLPGPS